MLKSIHHVQITIPPGCETEARSFYCETLGLNEIPKPQVLKEKGGFWTELGGMQIHVSVQQVDFNRYALNSHICFEVSGLAAWKEKLAMRNILLEPVDVFPGVNRIMLRDPFGNRLELLERVEIQDRFLGI